MSDDTVPPEGLAVRCDRAGTVVEVLIDTLDSGLRPGGAFTEVVGRHSIQAALGLLADAHREPGNRPVALDLLDGRDGGRLHAVGCSTDSGHVVVVGAPTIAGLPPVVDAATSSAPGVHDTLHQLIARGRAERVDEDVLNAMSETNNELIRMHRELAGANAKLDQLDRRKNEILAMVAHDLRNPLGSLAGYGAALERQLDGTFDATSRQMLSRIQALSNRMLELVEDLLDTSVINNDTLQLDIEATDLHRLLRDTVANHQHAAMTKMVELCLDVGQPTVMAWVDDSRLVQVIDNLLSNAIKFSPAQAGTRVQVTCRTPDADHVAITVQDEGVGLPAEERERLFEPFARRSRIGTADERGTGLGLAITRSIVDAHGGDIDVDSEVGKGSTFTVTLPISPRSPI